MMFIKLTAIRKILTKFSVFRGIYIKSEIDRVNGIFPRRDFSITNKDSNVFVNFSSKNSFAPNNKIVVEYLYKKGVWKVNFKDFEVLSIANPLFEIVNELRGYTLLDNISKGDVVIDVGSSDGFISAYFAKKVGAKGKIVSIESDGNILDTLKQTVRENKLHNIYVINKALVPVNTEFSNKNQINLEQISRNIKIDKKKINFIKLDIEGGEIDLLPDLLDIVKHNKKCVIAIASYHIVNGRQSNKIIMQNSRSYKWAFIRTVYQSHTTTYIINRNNRTIYKKLLTIVPVK